MKKQVEKRVVQTSMTKAQIEHIGFQAYIDKTYRRTCLVLTLMVLSAVGLSFWQAWAFGVMGLATFGYWLVWSGRASKAGRKYWDDNKDKPEPIVLEK